MRFKESIKRFTLPKGWAWGPIEGLAKVSFSSVDKKSVEGEKPVRLCNYMDVFYNRRIREGMPFMVSTASDSDIKKFTLSKGDVVLTKDSETPEEIAFAAVIDEDIDNLVCGYHLAVLRPDKTKVVGEYLMSAINFHPNHHQFVRLANGATRFGLGIDSLNNALLPLPPLAEQRKIAEILRTWDEAIETAEAELKAKQERKRGLMQKLLNPVTEGAGAVSKKAKYTPLGSLVTKIEGGGTPSKEVAGYWNGDIPLLTIKDLPNAHLGITVDQITTTGLESSSAKIVPVGIPVIATRMDVGKVVRCPVPVAINQDLRAIYPDQGKVDVDYIVQVLPTLEREFCRYSCGSTVMGIGIDDLKSVKIYLPPLAEQRKIAEVLRSEDEAIDSLKAKADLLRNQKRGLMQKLLTGEVRVAA